MTATFRRIATAVVVVTSLFMVSKGGFGGFGGTDANMFGLVSACDAVQPKGRSRFAPTLSPQASPRRRRDDRRFASLFRQRGRRAAQVLQLAAQRCCRFCGRGSPAKEVPACGSRAGAADTLTWSSGGQKIGRAGSREAETLVGNQIAGRYRIVRRNPGRESSASGSAGPTHRGGAYFSAALDLSWGRGHRQGGFGEKSSAG